MTNPKGRKKFHKLPLVCRVPGCGEDRIEYLVKDVSYEEGVTRLCKRHLAERLRQYRRGELITTYVGNWHGREKPLCLECGEDNPNKLVKCQSGRFGLAARCKACKAKSSMLARRQATPPPPKQCKHCGTENEDKLIKNPRSRSGYSSVCKGCRYHLLFPEGKPEEAPVVCTQCGTKRRLLMRSGKPIRMCRKCKSAEAKTVYAAKRLRVERLSSKPE